MLEGDFLDKLARAELAKRKADRETRKTAYFRSRGQPIVGESAKSDLYLTQEERKDLMPFPTAWRPPQQNSTNIFRRKITS